MKLLLLFLLTTVGSSAKSLFSRTYSPTDVPNPMLHPEACGRSGVPKSAICDPSLLLLKDNKDVIEGFINGVVGAVVAVAIVDEMTPSFVAGDDKEVAAKRFAKSLHDDWGVGDKDTNNGILIFLSINDRTVYISTGAGVKGKVTAQYVDYLISEMKPDLKAGNYGTAIEKTVTQIRLIMSDQSDIAKRISSGEWSDNWFIGLLVAGGLAVSGVAVHNTRKLNQLRRGRVALDKFMSEVEEASDHKKFISESCPICLEQFSTFRAAGDGHVEEANAEGNVYNKLSTTGDTEEVGKKKDLEVGISPTTSGVKDDSPKRAMALHCGHVFCYGEHPPISIFSSHLSSTHYSLNYQHYGIIVIDALFTCLTYVTQLFCSIAGYRVLERIFEDEGRYEVSYLSRTCIRGSSSSASSAYTSPTTSK